MVIAIVASGNIQGRSEKMKNWQKLLCCGLCVTEDADHKQLTANMPSKVGVALAYGFVCI